jgi:hypothetical protein
MRRNLLLSLSFALASCAAAFAATPKLNIRTRHGNDLEERKKQQMERLAAQYDLAKYTITRDIMIEQGAINHSMPVLTLNLRFLENDDLALSAYVHEQGHWLLLQHRNELNAIFSDLLRQFPNLDPNPPRGSGTERDTYFHIVVCMLEWQAMEELVGPERARREIEWKQGDHYTDIYRTIVEHRTAVEAVMNRYQIKF